MGIRTLSFMGLAVTLLACTGVAAGQDPGPAADSTPPLEDASGADQYSEEIPTASGPKAPRGGGGSAPLPPTVAAQLRSEGGDDVRLLERIAQSEELGAPQRERASRKPGDPLTEAAAERAGDEGSTALSAAASVVADGADDRRMAGLLIALVAIAALTLATAVRRRRGHGK